MNKKILKILICTFVFIIGISAVSAMEINSDENVALQPTSDDVVAVNDDKVISVEEKDVVAVNDDKVISVEEKDDKVISKVDESDIVAGSDEDVISEVDASDVVASSDDNKVIAGENNNILTLNNDNTKLSSSDSSSDIAAAETVIYKSVYVGKIKVPKKYLKYPESKIPKKLKVSIIKQMKKLKKSTSKKVKKMVKNNWQIFDTSKIDTKIKGKYAYIMYYIKFFKSI